MIVCHIRTEKCPHFIWQPQTTFDGFFEAIIIESQKDAYSENFIKIRPQTAKLGVGTVDRPKLNFCCTILAEICRFGISNVKLAKI